MAAMCLQTSWAQDYGLPQDPLQAAVLVSGLYDLLPLRHPSTDNLMRGRDTKVCPPNQHTAHCMGGCG
jgi:hypothetical protein